MSVAIDPVDPSILVAGGRESGVFLSSDGGQSWAVLTDPFGTSSIPHLPRPFFAHFDHEAGETRVYVGSVGRGVWRIELADAELSSRQGRLSRPGGRRRRAQYTPSR